MNHKKGVTQEKLSESVGISPKYLSRIERGKENPTPNTLLKLVRSLDVNFDEIFRNIQVENPANRRVLINSLLDEDYKKAKRKIKAHLGRVENKDRRTYGFLGIKNVLVA